MSSSRAAGKERDKADEGPYASSMSSSRAAGKERDKADESSSRAAGKERVKADEGPYARSDRWVWATRSSGEDNRSTFTRFDLLKLRENRPGLIGSLLFKPGSLLEPTPPQSDLGVAGDGGALLPGKVDNRLADARAGGDPDLVAGVAGAEDALLENLLADSRAGGDPDLVVEGVAGAGDVLLPRKVENLLTEADARKVENLLTEADACAGRERFIYQYLARRKLLSINNPEKQCELGIASTPAGIGQEVEAVSDGLEAESYTEELQKRSRRKPLVSETGKGKGQLDVASTSVEVDLDHPDKSCPEFFVHMLTLDDLDNSHHGDQMKHQLSDIHSETDEVKDRRINYTWGIHNNDLTCMIMAVVTFNVLMPFVPLPVLHMDDPTSVVWRMSLAICTQLFLLILPLRTMASIFDTFSRILFGPLLAFATTCLVSPLTGMTIVYLSTALAAGMFGYYLAQYRLHVGTEQSVILDPRVLSTDERRNRLYTQIQSVFYSSIMIPCLMGLMVWVMFLPVDVDVYFVVWGLSVMLWCIMYFALLTLSTFMLHQQLVAEHTIAYYIASFPASIPFALVSQLIWTYFFGLEMMLIAGYFGYVLAIYAHCNELLPEADNNPTAEEMDSSSGNEGTTATEDCQEKVSRFIEDSAVMGRELIKLAEPITLVNAAGMENLNAASEDVTDFMSQDDSVVNTDVIASSTAVGTQGRIVKGSFTTITGEVTEATAGGVPNGAATAGGVADGAATAGGVADGAATAGGVSDGASTAGGVADGASGAPTAIVKDLDRLARTAALIDKLIDFADPCATQYETVNKEETRPLLGSRPSKKVKREHQTVVERDLLKGMRMFGC